MSAFAERVLQDLRKIEELSKAVAGRVSIKDTTGNPINVINLELDFPTAPSSKYPSQVQNKTLVKIELLSRYPFQEPLATITTPIYHPNVYSSGRVCLGAKWLPTQGLDLLVKRIIQIITFESNILNEASPANRDALLWYRSAIKASPDAFPTDKLIIKEQASSKIGWSNVSVGSEEKALVSCPSCHGSLRVPKGKKGNLTCPKCNSKFYIET
ncbi:ubiquitin-conjugating enzyme E2 [Pseudomonas sp. McL0111]|uniref:ubiquitin-conjugating enzyme E2 n=1 Tax=Pseudomonas sp. McL0111 TaxID=3457357 RepID=UPI00403E383E